MIRWRHKQKKIWNDNVQHIRFHIVTYKFFSGSIHKLNAEMLTENRKVSWSNSRTYPRKFLHISKNTWKHFERLPFSSFLHTATKIKLPVHFFLLSDFISKCKYFITPKNERKKIIKIPWKSRSKSVSSIKIFTLKKYFFHYIFLLIKFLCFFVKLSLL